MNVSEIKYRLATRRMARTLKLGSKVAALKSVGKIVVVLDSNDSVLWGEFFALKEKLGVKDPDFVMISLAEIEEDATGILSFSSGDLGWNGSIRSKEMLSVLEENYEALVVFTSQSSPLQEFLVQTITAQLKIGREEKSSSLYDLSISVRFEEVAIFLLELRKYLKILKKN